MKKLESIFLAGNMYIGERDMNPTFLKHLSIELLLQVLEIGRVREGEGEGKEGGNYRII